MLSLDEAISQEKELFEHCKRLYEPLSDEDKSINPLLKNEIEYHKQLAEWLEELKAIKSNGRYVQGNKAGQKIGYNKAIDDAKSVILQTLDNEILIDTLNLRLEQLKAGGAE